MENFSLLVCSDIHYASDAEKARGCYESQAIEHPLARLFIRFYRHFIWLRDPFAHNELLRHVLEPSLHPDLVIANGDFSCDSAFIGMADPPSCESAAICIGKLRERYGEKFRGVFGDHELGKVTLAGGKGGLKLASLRVAQEALGLEPFWEVQIGKYKLIAVTSSLIAMPVYQHEALPEERPEWLELSRAHLARINEAFAAVKPDEKVLLFCHDPTALPFLLNVPELKKRLGQIEKTVIGHLHSNLIVWQSRILSGLPHIQGMGAGVKRMSAALSKAKEWRHFQLLLCPSLSGIELFRRGGFYLVDIDPSGKLPSRWKKRTFRR
jgi:hypothetical protein